VTFAIEVHFSQSTEVNMNMFYPQGNFHSPGNFGYPPGISGQPGFHGIPFANTLYGYPQLTPIYQGAPQSFQPQAFQGAPQSGWQHPAQQQAQLQAALQQQALLQLLAPQLAVQPFALQNPTGTHALHGLTNGAAQTIGGWQQPLANPEQINPALQQQSQQHLLQRLAQYHYLVAQQLAQLLAQQTAQISGYPYTGQFIPVPGQMGANFVPGVTMH
jgi:hypothetical protein